MKTVLILILVEIFTIIMQREFCEQALERRQTGKAIQAGMWIFFYVFSNVFTYFGQLPFWVDLIIFVTLFYAVLTLVYEGTISKKLKIVAFMFFLGVISESIVFRIGTLLMGIDIETALQETEIRFMYAVLSKLVWFIGIKIALLILKKIKCIQNKIADWMEVFFIPVSSIFIVIAIFEPYSEWYFWMKLIAAFLLLIINLAVFYIYNELQENALYRAEKEFLTQQVESYVAQLQRMGELWQEVRTYKHDMKQKYLLVQSYLEQGAYEKLRDFYAESIAILKDEECISKTGNICFDTIINYKAAIAEERGITVNTDTLIPYDMQFEEEDLYSLLGNLLDNAIEAAEMVEPDERMIKLMAKVSGNNLYLEIRNPYQGELKKKGKQYLTLKQEKKEHGLGLRIVEDIVKRHNGDISIDSSGNYFKVTVFLYDIGN